MDVFEDVRTGDSFERWHHATCRNYSITECRPVRSRAFSGEVKVRPFGELAISHIGVQTSPGDHLVVQRDRREIRKDYRDDFLIWVGRSGTTVLEQQGRTVRLKAGDISVHDQAAPFRLSFTERSSVTTILVRRQLMLARFPQAAQCVAMHTPAQAPLAQLAAATAAGSFPGAGTGPGGMPDRAWGAALDIWISALQSGLPTSPGDFTGERPGRLQLAQQYLRQHLHDPTLDLAGASAALHMSSRTLLRLFAAQGTTPMRWLWQERIARCHDALSRGQFERVSDAAFACGFRNLSHFSRMFKAQYGTRASQLVQDESAGTGEPRR